MQKDALDLPIDNNTAMGDYLHGFFEGLCAALRGKGRQIITIHVPQITEFELGQIIALYERTVAVYAEFININAFHQPGVQAYKLAAKDALELRRTVLEYLKNNPDFAGSAAELAAAAGIPDAEVEIASLLDRAAVNGKYVIRTEKSGNWSYSVK